MDTLPSFEAMGKKTLRQLPPLQKKRESTKYSEQIERDLHEEEQKCGDYQACGMPTAPPDSLRAIQNMKNTQNTQNMQNTQICKSNYTHTVNTHISIPWK